MALLNMVYDYQLTSSIRSGKQTAQNLLDRNEKYIFSDDWTQKQKLAFFLCETIFDRFEDTTASYYEYVQFMLRDKTPQRLAAEYLKKVLDAEEPEAVAKAWLERGENVTLTLD